MATMDETQMLAEDKFEYFKDICNVYKAIENCEDIEEIKKKVSVYFTSFCYEFYATILQNATTRISCVDMFIDQCINIIL